MIAALGTRPLRERIFAGAVLIALAILVISTQIRTRNPADGFAGSDFVAFYCAGDVIAAHGDPYRAAPLSACERQEERAIGLTPSDIVDPAPLPPFTLALLAPLARLSYPAAATLWTYGVLLAFGITVWALRRVVGVPWYAIAAALALGDYAANALFGQLPPPIVAALALSGAALAGRRPRLAAVLATLTLLQPNVGLPVVGAMLLWVPAARVALLLSVASFAAFGLVVGGLPETLLYAHAVLPAQALGEVPRDNQFSLTWLAWVLGSDDATALRIGSVQYALTAALGILVARPLARRLDSTAVIVFAPAAAAVVLGSYVHANQFVYAIPLALVIASAAPARSRIAAWAAMLLFTIHFTDDAGRFVVLFEVALAAVAIRFAFPNATLLRRCTALAAATVLAIAIVAGLGRLSVEPIRPADDVASFRAAGFDLGLASAAMGLQERLGTDQQGRSALEIGRRLPPWAGLLLLLGTAVTLAVRRPAVALVRVKGNQFRAEGGRTRSGRGAPTPR